MIYSNFIHVPIPDPDCDRVSGLHQYILIYFVEPQIRTFTDITYLCDFLFAPDDFTERSMREFLSQILTLHPRDRLAFDIDYQIDVEEPGFEIQAKEVATLICCNDITVELQQIDRLLVNFHEYRINE